MSVVETRITRAQDVIADYIGIDRTRIVVEVVADPQVEGAFAIRAVVRKNKRPPLTFLVTQQRRDFSTLTADDLEEVSFATWPPHV